MAFLILLIVEEIEHSRSFGNGEQQIPKISECIFPDFVEDMSAKIGVDNPACKMAVPKKGHLLPELIFAMHHFIQEIKVDFNITLSIKLLHLLFVCGIQLGKRGIVDIGLLRIETGRMKFMFLSILLPEYCGRLLFKSRNLL